MEGLEVTKPRIIESLIREEYTTAIIAALQLGEEDVIKDVIIRIPLLQVSGVVEQIGGFELISLVKVLGLEIGRSIELGLLMLWVKEICKNHSTKLRGRTEIRAMFRNLAKKYQEVAWITQENTYILQYLSR